MRKEIKYFETYEITDLKDMLIKTTEKNYNKTAFKLKDGNGKIYYKTYSEFKKDVEGLATKLINMGMQNKRVAVMGKNSYSWAVSYLAIVIVGIIVPIDKEASNENIRDFLNISKTDAVIADSKYLDKIFTLKNEIKNKIILIDTENTSKYTNLEDLIKERKRFSFKRKQRL